MNEIERISAQRPVDVTHSSFPGRYTGSLQTLLPCLGQTQQLRLLLPHLGECSLLLRLSSATCWVTWPWYTAPSFFIFQSYGAVREWVSPSTGLLLSDYYLLLFLLVSTGLLLSDLPTAGLLVSRGRNCSPHSREGSPHQLHSAFCSGCEMHVLVLVLAFWFLALVHLGLSTRLGSHVSSSMSNPSDMNRLGKHRLYLDLQQDPGKEAG